MNRELTEFELYRDAQNAKIQIKKILGYFPLDNSRVLIVSNPGIIWEVKSSGTWINRGKEYNFSPNRYNGFVYGNPYTK